MFNILKDKKWVASEQPAQAKALSPAIIKADSIERRIMRDVAASLKRARDDLALAEQQVTMLEHAIAVGKVADEAFKSSPRSAEALERIASGNVSDDNDVSAMLLRQQAARTAQDILPAAKERLEAAHKAVQNLSNQTHTAAVNCLRPAANNVAQRYKEAWFALIDAHDTLVGYSHALPPAEQWQDAIWTGATHFEVPGFVLSALGNARKLEHNLDENKVAKAQAALDEARERLMADPDSEIDDLLDDAA